VCVPRRAAKLHFGHRDFKPAGRIVGRREVAAPPPSTTPGYTTGAIGSAAPSAESVLRKSRRPTECSLILKPSRMRPMAGPSETQCGARTASAPPLCSIITAKAVQRRLHRVGDIDVAARNDRYVVRLAEFAEGFARLPHRCDGLAVRIELQNLTREARRQVHCLIVVEEQAAWKAASGHVLMNFPSMSKIWARRSWRSAT
jgi:hypothetical protein